MNHHLCRGGHLSAQPMGALRDFVAVDPLMERRAVIEFPVLEEDPYQIDLGKDQGPFGAPQTGVNRPRKKHDDLPGTTQRARSNDFRDAPQTHHPL